MKGLIQPSNGGIPRWQFNENPRPILYDGWCIARLGNDLTPYLFKNRLALERMAKDGFENPEIELSVSNLMNVIAHSTHYAEIRNKKGELNGFAFFYVKHDFQGQQTMCYVNKICISFQMQGCGLASKLIEAMIKKYSIGLLAARTQNFNLIKLLSRFSSRKITFPISGAYGDCDAGQLALEQLNNVPQLANTLINSNGIAKACYGRALNIGSLRKSTAAIQDRLDELNFDRNAGDAVIITSQIKY